MLPEQDSVECVMNDTPAVINDHNRTRVALFDMCDRHHSSDCACVVRHVTFVVKVHISRAGCFVRVVSNGASKLRL